MFQRQRNNLLKVFRILGIRQWIAALDEIDAQFVQLLRDEQLVLEGEVDAFALAAVSQSGVVDFDSWHGIS